MKKSHCKHISTKSPPKVLVIAVLCAVYLHIHLLMYVFTYNSEPWPNYERKTLRQQHEMDVTEHVIRSTKRIGGSIKNIYVKERKNNNTTWCCVCFF